MCVNCIKFIPFFLFLTHVCIPDFNDAFLLTLSAQEYPFSHWFDSTETHIWDETIVSLKLFEAERMPP